MAASAAVAATAAVPRLATARTTALSLTATSRVIDVDGRAATVMGLVNGAGGLGLTLNPTERFRVDLTNASEWDTIIHWHGQPPECAGRGAGAADADAETGRSAQL